MLLQVRAPAQEAGHPEETGETPGPSGSSCQDPGPDLEVCL